MTGVQTCALPISGAALAFAVQRDGTAEVWVASDTATGAVKIAAGKARFGPLAFSAGGKALYYGSKLPGGTRRVDLRRWCDDDGAGTSSVVTVPPPGDQIHAGDPARGRGHHAGGKEKSVMDDLGPERRQV